MKTGIVALCVAGGATSVDEAVTIITPEFAAQHKDWTSTNRVGAIIRGMYAE